MCVEEGSRINWVDTSGDRTPRSILRTMPTTPARASFATSPAARDTGATRTGGSILASLLPRSLRGRLALTQVGLVVAVLMALGIYLAVAGRQLYVDRLAEQLAAQAQIVAAAVEPSLEA